MAGRHGHHRILAGLLLPALGSAKKKAHGITCLNNLKQLTLGWTLYPDDNNEKLMFNYLACILGSGVEI